MFCVQVSLQLGILPPGFDLLSLALLVAWCGETQYGWYGKSRLISVLSCLSPARGVCRRQAGPWEDQDSKHLVSLSFVPWLPGSAGAKNKANTVLA